MKAFIKVGRR